MKLHRASCAALLAGALAVSLAGVAQADSSARVEAASAPAGTDARLTRALRNSVSQHLADAGLTASLNGYSLSPSLVQLRHYSEPGAKRVRTVCIVGLALNSEHGVVADVRGNAVTIGATSLEAVDAAAGSAVSRLPEVLAKLGEHDANARVAER